MRRKIRTRMMAATTLTIAAALAWSVPAAAQPADQRISQIFLDAVQANLDHIAAANRCDQQAMDDAKARLAQLERDARRASDAAQAAGAFSEVPPAVARAIFLNVQSLKTQADGRQASICPAESTSTSATVPGSGAPAGRGIPGPLGQPDLAALRAAYREAAQGCDVRSFNAAKQLLLEALNRAIAAELNDDVLSQLTRERYEVSTAQPACDGILEEIEEPIEQPGGEPVEIPVGPPGPPEGPPVGPPPGPEPGSIAPVQTGYSAPPPAGDVSVAVSLGAARIPEGTIGFVERDGAEVPAGATRKNVGFFGLGAFAHLRRLGIMLGGHYAEGDGRTAFDVEPDVRSGHPYASLSPGGSTGISATEGYSGSTEVEIQDFSVRGAVGLPGARVLPVFDIPFFGGPGFYRDGFDSGSTPIDPSSPLGSMFGASFWTEYRHSDRDYRLEGGAAGTTAGGFAFNFSQNRAFDIEEDQFAAGFNAALAGVLGENVLVSGGASAGVYYRDSSFRFVERNVANFGPAADQDFTIEIEEEDDGFGFRGDVGATLALRASPTATFWIGGSASWFSSVAAPDAPVSGDDVLAGEEAGLRSRDAWIYRGLFGVTLQIP